MNWIHHQLQANPEIALFLTLSIGVVVGRLRFRSFSLGLVTATLLAGVLVGQWNIPISKNVQSVAFLLFIFAIGYKVGPQFVRGLRSDGLPQVLFAAVVCTSGLLTAFVVAKLFGFGPGYGAGLLGGALTQSAVIGVSQEAIDKLAVSADVKHHLAGQVPVGYAVTYVMGTVGVAYFVSAIAPRLMRTNLVSECAALETELGVPNDNLDQRPAYYDIVFRSYRMTPSAASEPISVADFEAAALARGHRLNIVRIQPGGASADGADPPTAIVTAETDSLLRAGDEVAVTSNRRDLVGSGLGTAWAETDNRALLDFTAETLKIIVPGRERRHRTVGDLRDDPAARGVYLERVVRGGVVIDWTRASELQRGDELTITGAAPLVERAAHAFGRPVRSSIQTDLLYVGVGIFLGALIGIPAVTIAGISIGLTTSGGALIAGLLFGWARSRYPAFGYLPDGAQWLLDTGMLAIFIAVVGLRAGPDFVSGIDDAGFSLFLAGCVVTLVPQIIGLYVGRYVFRFRVPILLGMLAGAQTVSAGLGALREQSKSPVPALGYTVPYAVGNTLLTIWGTLIVTFLS